ncbi:uncharacterized protein LOC113782440 [Coffea eugenioides]|uniref:uncharacterized protein LOC113782440 n=1 Tax=Coffea eugenioides TaxID=49369 RepID=UPI000F60682D|nr:uncharacterized protein LOC113782440 [Coffea eugenioides]
MVSTPGGKGSYKELSGQGGSILEAKARIEWLQDGNKNLRFFHAVVAERCAKSVIHWIRSSTGEWLTDKTHISTEAVEYFTSLFSAEPCTGSWNTLEVIPNVISRDQNAELERLPSMEEIKEVVFAMDGESATGPDGFTARLSKVWPSIISPQQSGFVKGRQIFDNFLLAQELVSDIHRKNREGNVVLKLDMAKAYDRVSWPFLLQVLRRFGFGEVWIDMIWRLISNVWFSVIVNGAPQGFFKSSRGLRQGDSISPALFVISAEVLSRLLNALSSYRGFTPFRVPRGCLPITHLAYANDIIIFSSGLWQSVQLVMKTLDAYGSVKRSIAVMTGFQSKEFSVKHLGYPLYAGRRRRCYFAGGGAGLRSLKHVFDAFSMRLWWHFQLRQSLWAKFVHCKYCPNLHPCFADTSPGDSWTW